MIEIIAKEGQDLDLGKRGENLARRVTFDIGGWIKTFGEGEVHLLHQRNGDKTPYPCVVEVEKTKAYWPVTNTDVAMAGRGHAEIQYWVGDAIVKSVTYNTRVAQSMGVAGDTPPAPAENWLNTMLGLGNEAKVNAEAAAESAEAAAASVAMAKISETNAAESESNAKASESAASDSATAAAESAAESKLQADRAEEMKDQVQEAVDGAIISAVKRVEEVVEEAEAAEQGAKDAQAAAEKARDEAAAVAGGDFLPLTGGKLTGNLEISRGIPTLSLTVPGGSAYAEIKKNAGTNVDMGTNINDFASAGNYTQLNLSHADRALRLRVTENGVATGAYDIYHEGNLTPEAIGAVSRAEWEASLLTKATVE